MPDLSNFKRHWFRILAGPNNREQQVMCEWKDLPFEVMCKWRWYFDYRAALVKVQHPKWVVEVFWGGEAVTVPGIEHLKRVKDRISSKKGKITECLNKVQTYQNNWKSLFPIDQDVPYCNALAKIHRLKTELQEMEDEYQELINLTTCELPAF